MGKSPYMQKLSDALGNDLVIVPGVAALIRDDEGRLLLERRADNGCWDLPAGAIDPGETPREALEREVLEETGLHVEVRGVAGIFGGAAFRHRYQDGQHVEGFVAVFDCVVTGGALRSGDGESAGLRFVCPDEMPSLMMPYPAELFRPDRGTALFQ
jgi:8-oxo-dGTP pyrophosphatase MutT (NUDIX family)